MNKMDSRYLKKAVNIYKKGWLKNLLKVEEFYLDQRSKRSLGWIIEYASKGWGPDEKMDSHQRRVGYEACGFGSKELLKLEKDIEVCRSFKALYAITQEVSIDVYRLGPLWAYDTALRIGFYMDIYPDEVYVQAGVVKGVKWIKGSEEKISRTMPLGSFPKTVRELRPFEIENFLCVWGNPKNRTI